MAQALPIEVPAPSARVDVRFSDLLWALGGAVGGFVAALVFLIFAAIDRTFYTQNEVLLVLAGPILSYAGLFVGILRFVRRLPNPWRWLGLRRPRPSDFGLVGGLVLLWFVGEAIIILVITNAFNHGQQVQSNARDMFNNQAQGLGVLVLALIATAIVAPVCEELFFRGMLYRYLLRRWPVWGAAVVSATVFSALHFIPILIPVFLFLGLILTIQYEITGSLTNSMMIHATGNAITTVLVYISLTGGS